MPLVVCVPALISCQDPLAVNDCPAQVEITLSAGATPDIDWAPRCHVNGLLIFSAYTGATIWTVYAEPPVTCDDNGNCTKARNTLYPPVRYGVVPPGSSQSFPVAGAPPAPLLVGWPYSIYLRRANPPDPREVWLAADTFVVSTAPSPAHAIQPATF